MLVKAARQKELQYFESKHVWQISTVAEALKATGRRPISVRWVDVNKGDDETPNVRSRLVAREIRAPGTDSACVLNPAVGGTAHRIEYRDDEVYEGGG